MIAVYLLVTVTLTVALVSGYVIAALLPGRIVEGVAVAFVLGVAYTAEVYPWIERRLGAEEET